MTVPATIFGVFVVLTLVHSLGVLWFSEVTYDLSASAVQFQWWEYRFIRLRKCEIPLASILEVRVYDTKHAWINKPIIFFADWFGPAISNDGIFIRTSHGFFRKRIISIRDSEQIVGNIRAKQAAESIVNDR
jgi:hypothetical protein